MFEGMAGGTGTSAQGEQQNNFLYNHWVSVPWTSIFRKFFKRFSLGTIQSMEVWDGYLERQGRGICFKAPWPNPVRVFFSIEASFHSKKMQNASSIASLFTNSLAILWCLFDEDTLFLPRPYHGGRQEHNGNNVFSSFGASKKVRLENLPNNFWSWSRQRFFLAKVDAKKDCAWKDGCWESLRYFFVLVAQPPWKMEETTYLPTYLNWLDLVHE